MEYSYAAVCMIKPLSKLFGIIIIVRNYNSKFEKNTVLKLFYLTTNISNFKRPTDLTKYEDSPKDYL